MAKRPPAYSHFVEAPDAPCSALQWFSNQDLACHEHPFDRGTGLHFSGLGQLQQKLDGSIDLERSPVVKVTTPQIRRGILWTVGEVCFCPTPLRQFPKLERLRRTFLRWFEEYPLIYDHHPDGKHEFDYYLEGSSRNWGPIRAFPSGLAALENGQYFVSHHDGRLDTVCRTLALRGVVCADEDHVSPQDG